MDPALWEVIAREDADAEIEAILRLRDPAVHPPGVRVITQFGDIATCRLPVGRILEVRAHESVASLKANRALGADGWTPNAAYPTPDTLAEDDPSLGATGANVVLGVADWGVDLRHAGFRHPDGRTRLLALWDQSAPYDPDRPNKYAKGRIHTAAEIDRALDGEDPYTVLGYHPAPSSHGTHVLGIAAGNGRDGCPLGVAPEAAIVFVHLATSGTGGLATLGDAVSIVEAMDFIFDTAGPLPVCINYSIGRHGGPHDGSTPLERACEAALAERPGRAIAQSGGNYFQRGIHSAGRVEPGGARTLRFEVAEDNRAGAELEVWYSGADAFLVEVASPDRDITVRVRLGHRTDLRGDGDALVGRVYHRARDPNNGDHHVDLFLYPDAPAGVWTLTLIGEAVVDGGYHAWIEREGDDAGLQTRFHPDDTDPRSTTGTIANARTPICVGAVDSHNPGRPLAPFSSAGPTRDGRRRPDLVASGVRISAARSQGDDEEGPACTVKSGTSMASPRVAGTVACMFQAAGRPLPIVETRRLLLEQTDPPPADASPVDAERYGAGYLNTSRAVAAARALALESSLPAPARISAPLEVIMARTPDSESRPVVSAAPLVVDAVVPGVSPVLAPTGERWNRSLPRRFTEVVGGLEADAPDQVGGPLTPAYVFDQFAFGTEGSSPRAVLESRFAVVAAPGGLPVDAARPGDIVLTRAFGEGELAHAFVIAAAEEDGGLLEALSLGEGTGAGARRWTVGPGGRMPPDRMVLRPLTETAGFDAEAVTSQYPTLQRLLTYGVFDWAITDAEATQALQILRGLGNEELIDTYFQMLTDGLWNRLESNIPGSARSTWSALQTHLTGLFSTATLTADEQRTVRRLCEWFYPGNPPPCVNAEVTQVILEMFHRAAIRCSNALDWVPRPFLSVPQSQLLRWLAKKGAKMLFDRARRGARVYEICRTTIAGAFRSPYEIAKNTCSADVAEQVAGVEWAGAVEASPCTGCRGHARAVVDADATQERWAPSERSNGATPPAVDDATLELVEAAEAVNVTRAVRFNRLAARWLPWAPHRAAIAGLIGVAAGASDEDFALAVGTWQAAHGLGEDGLLGACTWSVMRPLVGAGPTVPCVSRFRFRNAGATDAANCCAVCAPAVNLGVGIVRAVGPTGQNGMELRFTLQGHRAGFTYDITRTRRNSLFEFRGGVWTRLEADPMGTNDDHHNDDECLTPTGGHIWAIDTPGWNMAMPAALGTTFGGVTAGVTHADATEVVARFSFAEWVICRNPGEGIGWTRISLPIAWHSINWLHRTAGGWVVDPRSAIARGSISGTTIRNHP